MYQIIWISSTSQSHVFLLYVSTNVKEKLFKGDSNFPVYTSLHKVLHEKGGERSDLMQSTKMSKFSMRRFNSGGGGEDDLLQVRIQDLVKGGPSF